MTIRLEDESLSLVAHREEDLPITHNCWTRSAIRTALTNASIYKSKTHTSAEGEVRCRLCGKAPESVRCCKPKRFITSQIAEEIAFVFHFM